MKFPNHSNPGLIASDDETRYILQWVRLETHAAIATDGKRLIVQIVYPDDDDERGECMIPPQAIKAARKQADTRVKDECHVQIGSDSVTVSPYFPEDGTLTWNTSEFVGEYPNWVQVIPARSERIRVGLDAKYLLKICRALQGKRSNTVFLDIDPQMLTGPMIVTAPKNGIGFAILMPVNSEGGKPGNAAEIEDNRAWRYAQDRLAEQQAKRPA